MTKMRQRFILKIAGLGSTRGRWGRLGVAQKLAAVFLVMLLVAGLNVALFKCVVDEFRDVAGTVAVAGKLRMLSQKIELDVVQFATGPSRNSDAILDGISEFDTLLAALADGGRVFDVTVRQLETHHGPALDAVQEEWSQYRTAISAALAGPAAVSSPPSGHALSTLRNQITVHATRLLHASEQMVVGIVKDMQQRQHLAMIYMYAAFVVALLAFALGFLFVRRHIIGPLRLLHDGAKRLRSGDYGVRLQYASSDEIGQLVQTFNAAADHLGELIDDLERGNQSLERAQAMFRGLVENSGIGVYVVHDRRFLFVNQKMAALLGYGRSEMIYELDALDIFIEEDRERVAESRRKRLRGEVSETYAQRQGRRRDGSAIDLEIFGSAMQLDERIVTMCVVLDITQRKKDEASARLARLVYETSSEAMVITDANAYVIDINPAFTQITGYHAPEIRGRKMSMLSSGRHDKTFYQEMWSAISRTGTWQGEIWNRRKNGDEYAERLSVNTYYDELGNVKYRVGLFSDITKRKKTEALIWRQANFDCLTGLPNRKMLQDQVESAVARAQVDGMAVALAFLDLDDFKEVNDTLGHHAGDQLLQQVASRLQACAGPADTVGRMGGDEFMIIMADVRDPGRADELCQHMLAALSQPFSIEDETVTVTASIGVTLCPRDGCDSTQMFKNADMAMYAAKSKGRNQYCRFVSGMQENIAARRRLGRELTEALERDEFMLVYQPIIDMSTGKVCKAEALIRWNHPERGTIGPAEFIPFAEDSGVITAIGDWVFREAARQVARWRRYYQADFQVSINVSPAQFGPHGDGYTQWLTLLKQLKSGGQSVVVEITEGLLMDACGAVTRQLRAFRDGGIQIALDDFGTGYSSLSYLKKFDIDYIKIDRSFVSNLGPDTDDRALCDAMIVMAHRLGMQVVAEGIETEEQFRFLADAGCNYGQGYLFGRPMAPEQFVGLLQQH